MIGGPVVENLLAAGTAGGIFAAFKAWRPALPWNTEVRKARRLAKQRRKTYSFGRTRDHNKIQDTGR